MPKKKTAKLDVQGKAQPMAAADLDQLSPVAQEQLDKFCRELALALRRITGRVPDERQMDLPKVV